jgi:hypothetical protein
LSVRPETGLGAADQGERVILTRPSRETTTVRAEEPALNWKLAFDKPVVMPRGEKVRSRAGVASVTPSAAGPGAVQCGRSAPTSAMRRDCADTERIAG